MIPSCSRSEMTAALTSSVLFTLLNRMNQPELLHLPSAFCWTRFGTEAGEPIEQILERKNRERHANGGVFFWGIGNSVAPGLAALIEQTETPEVLFSPIRTRPRLTDVRPPSVVAWEAGKTLAGEDFTLPATARVTSRGHAANQRPHYALVCRTPTGLELSDHGKLSLSALSNLVSGNPVGTSQVTAVVKRSIAPSTGAVYRVAFRAALVPPYFVRLRQPLSPEAGLAA